MASYKYECACDLGYASDRFGYCEGEYLLEQKLNVLLLSMTYWSSLDIDECRSDTRNNCSKNAWCINEVGSFDCQCKVGYDGDGIMCTRKSIIILST